MTIFATIPSANGTYRVEVGDMLGQIDVRLVTSSAPGTGTLRVEGVTFSGDLQQFGGASAIQMSSLGTGLALASEFGHFKALIFTIAGVSFPGATISVVASANPAAGPVGAYLGNRALITQSYVEANTKLGTQFYLRTPATIANGATWYMGFQTGALPVLIKARDCYALAESLSITLFKGSTYTGGTPIVVQNYNDVAPVATTVTAAAGVTPSSNGTQWGGSEHIYGANSVAQRTGSGLPPGGDRVLAPNKAYMVALQNNGSGSVSADYFLTWFEGQPDLPRS